MTSSEIRQKFLDFYSTRGGSALGGKEKGHVIIPSSSLIPQGDSTTLFTGSGMQPLLPYLLGESHPAGARLVDSQKSFRAEDIDEVGDNRHTTFFEMLGNWSLGDYFKEQQLAWYFEFLTKVLWLDPKKLYVTAFAGDEEFKLPRDNETVSIWKKLFKEHDIEARDVELLTPERGGEVGMQDGRVFYYGDKNWWSRFGPPENMPIGEPGGPDSEVFYEFTDIPHDEKFGKYCHPNCDCGRFMEIGNSVFMQYKRDSDATFVELAKKNVDFGGGLERTLAAVQNSGDIFLINTFSPLIKFLEGVFQKKYSEEKRVTRSFRIMADHARGITFLLSDGVRPANKEAGYVLRRLMRRVFVYEYLYNLRSDTLEELMKLVIENYSDVYPELAENRNEIINTMWQEHEKFSKTIRVGMKELEKVSDLSGETAFKLYESYGLPYEVIKEFGAEKAKNLTREAFDAEFKKHQEKSKVGAEKKFGGHGLILDTGELKAGNEEELKKVTRLHTVTHMLQQALRTVLGESVHQAGSDITSERTRFDFTFDRKLTEEELSKIETMVNEKIKEDLPMQKVTLPLKDALETGALHFFSTKGGSASGGKEKYPDPVDVYFVGKDLENAWSKEFCGGPHVTHTGEIGKFKITKEEAVGAGMRRIRAMLE